VFECVFGMYILYLYITATKCFFHDGKVTKVCQSQYGQMSDTRLMISMILLRCNLAL